MCYPVPVGSSPREARDLFSARSSRLCGLNFEPNGLARRASLRPPGRICPPGRLESPRRGPRPLDEQLLSRLGARLDLPRVAAIAESRPARRCRGHDRVVRTTCSKKPDEQPFLVRAPRFFRGGCTLEATEGLRRRHRPAFAIALVDKSLVRPPPTKGNRPSGCSRPSTILRLSGLPANSGRGGRLRRHANAEFFPRARGIGESSAEATDLGPRRSPRATRTGQPPLRSTWAAEAGGDPKPSACPISRSRSSSFWVAVAPVLKGRAPRRPSFPPIDSGPPRRRSAARAIPSGEGMNFHMTATIYRGDEAECVPAASKLLPVASATMPRFRLPELLVRLA